MSKCHAQRRYPSLLVPLCIGRNVPHVCRRNRQHLFRRNESLTMGGPFQEFHVSFSHFWMFFCPLVHLQLLDLVFHSVLKRNMPCTILAFLSYSSAISSICFKILSPFLFWSLMKGAVDMPIGFRSAFLSSMSFRVLACTKVALIGLGLFALWFLCSPTLCCFNYIIGFG